MSHTPQPAGLIPDELLSNIKKGDCVLFLGADLPLGYEGAPLSRPELAAALAEKYQLPPGLPWPETAQAYLSKFPHDRNGLVRFIAERCSGPRVRPGPLHQAIARAGFRALVTAWYDELLEQTLQQAGYRVNRVVRDAQLPYAREGEREAIVIKLYGCLSDLESLILDKWDHEEWMINLSRKLEIVNAFCALRPPLFVGFDLADRAPIHLYVRASTNMVEHMRRAYAVWPHALDAARATWQDKNVEFAQADAAAFLEALSAQLPLALPGDARGAIRVRRPPYKFLDYYEAADADIFCGRDTESQIVARLALSRRWLTLFGPSGAGKTSLLLAGVLPRLAAEDYQHVYVRALDDPLPALRKAVTARAGRAEAEWQSGADLRAFLRAMLAPQDKLVVILDQFEELFLRVGTARRDAFFKELAAVLKEPEREVRFIFSLREDYLPRLDEARAWLPDIFANSYRLTALERSNARVAITEPAARAGLQVETALVDALVGSEGKSLSRAGEGQGGGGDLVEAGGHVPPAALQIVLDRLYREALPAGHPEHNPPPPGLCLRLSACNAIRHPQGEGEEALTLRGARAILAQYVGEGLQRLADLKREDGRTPLNADPELGKAILKVMITSQATKAALKHNELVSLLAEEGAIRDDDQADKELVENTRLGLERVRLLRGFERDNEGLYELAHDHLAAEIATWISAEEMQTKVARELLRREMDNWRHARLLIPLEALKLIHERRDDLKRLTPDECELLLRSALAQGYQVAHWFNQASQRGVLAEGIALEGLKDASFRARAAAVSALGQLGVQVGNLPYLIGMLADEYPQVRVAAILALEKLQPTGEWREHLKYECCVPAGKFIMGDDNTYDDEKPAHAVYLDAFYISKYPVTNADYERYMNDSRQPWNIPTGRANYPVVSITWYQACNYARWANMRLLTEAEWEKAASWEEPDLKGLDLQGLRGRKIKYPWGDEFDEDKCNTEESGIGGATPVGKYSPAGDSSYGCADMAGNVWEWTSSLSQSYPYRADDGREDMSSPDSRVQRGGSFNDEASFARCAFRFDALPNSDWNYNGFRCGF